MADITYSGTSTIRRNHASPVLGKGDSGNSKLVTTTVEVAASASGSTYKVTRVPSGARIAGLSNIYWDDLATSGSPTLDFGVASVGSNITSDPDGLNDGLAASATGSTALVKDRANYGKRAWEFVSGQTSDPGGELDIYFSVKDAATNAAGTVTLDLLYTLD